MRQKQMYLSLMLMIMTSLSVTYASGSKEIEFAQIPGDGKSIAPFEMSKTEITNQQYVDFLNAGLKKGEITVGDIEPLEKGQIIFAGYKAKNQQVVYDKNGNRLIDLLAVRVTGDHDHDHEFELWEMENPLNRIMVEYNSDKNKFNVVDPKNVDWSLYFDSNYLYEGYTPVDTITNWAELQDFWPEDVTTEGRELVTWEAGDYDKDVLFAGHLDLDFKLPTLEEVKKWPINHIEYYGAKAYADFYGYNLPTFKEIMWAAAGGKGYIYGTDDGTIHEGNVVYSGHSVDEYPKAKRGLDFSKFPGKDKGHVQPVASFSPNPYGVFDLSGNVYEWTESIDDGEFKIVDRVDEDNEAFIRVGGSWNYYDTAQSFTPKEAKNTGAHRGNDHFGFRVVNR